MGKTFSADEVIEMIDYMENALLRYDQPLDFVSVGAENYVFVGRVLRATDAMKRAVAKVAENE